MILELIQNIALLVTLAVGLQILARRFESQPTLYGLATGVLFGVVGIAGMMTPMHYAPGVIYDGRSIVLSLAGLFGGPVAAIPAAIMCAAYRIHLGGPGALAGVSVVIESTALGVALHYLRRRSEIWVSPVRLWLFGLLVHVIMLLLQLMIPNAGWALLRRIGPSVLIFYPIGFLLIAQIFLDGERRRKAVKALRDSEERYRGMFNNNHAVMLLIDPDKGRIVDANPAACAFYGWPADRLRSMEMTEMNTLTPEEIQAEINLAKTSRRHYSCFRHRRAGGDIRDVEVFSGPIRVEGKTLLYSIIHDITERKTAENAVREHNERTTLLNLVAQATIESRTPEEMADRLIGIVREVMPCDAAYIDVFDEEHLLAKGIRSYDTIDGVFRSVPARTVRIHPEKPVDRVIFFERQPLLLLRSEEAQECHDLSTFGDQSRRSASLLYSPMIARDRIVGSISAQSYKLQAYSEKEKELLFEIARQAGPAFEAVQQYAEARRAEEALRASEARWRLSIENMLEGYALHEAIFDESGRMTDYRFLEFNPAAQAILKVSREEVIGKTALEIFPHVVERGLFKRYAEVMATGKPAYIEDFYYTGDRLDKAFDIASFRIDGRHFVCMFRDVTERMKAAEALRKSEATLNSAQRLSKVGGWEWDVERQTMSWTRETFRIHDLDPDEVAADSREYIKKSLNCYPPDCRLLVREAFQRCAETGESYDFEFPFRTTQGRSLWVRTTAEAIREGDRIVKVVGNIMDITERKQAEEEKETLRAQLMQAHKMESVGRLAGGVAHDFNNMLGVILGHTDLALEQVDPGQPLHEDLQEIQKAAQRSADLTRQLLAFARRQTVAPKVLNLNETVGGMLKMLKRLIGEDIELVWSPDPGLWPIRIDPSQIDQILANLCVNSRDAITGVGQVIIETHNTTLDAEHCETHGDFVPGDYVLLTVSDNGCGMKRETLDHIFEPFFTGKEVGQGTGLGLATVYGIVKQNEGSITVYSEPNKGTTFQIYLPRYSGNNEGTIHREKTEAPRAQGETLLLVEDEAGILNLGKAMLERLGYTVLTAGSPTEAIVQTERHEGEIQLLITDVVMPTMNGRELEQRIQTIQPGIRCLFMSGYTADVIAHQGVLDKGVHFLQKPFSMQDLAAQVREALGEKKQGP